MPERCRGFHELHGFFRSLAVRAQRNRSKSNASSTNLFSCNLWNPRPAFPARAIGGDHSRARTL